MRILDMNINKISNTYTNNSFKGAYFVAGNGGQVKQTEDAISRYAKNNEDLNICIDKRIGDGYTTVELPAVIFVTTGEDVKKYNKFLANKDGYCKEIEKAYPDYLENKEFKTINERNTHKILRKAFINMKAIKKNCDFENGSRNLKAEDVLEAINKKKFDYKDGIIEA